MRHLLTCTPIIVRRALLSLSVVYFIPSATAAHSDIPALSLYEQCQQKEGRFACYAHPKRNNVVIYDEPNVSSRIISDAPIASTVFLVETKEGANTPGWLPVYTLDNNQGTLGWISSDSVVPVTSLHPVVKCWPLKTIRWSEPGFGDYDGGDFTIRFSHDGKLLPEYPVKVQHIVYYADSIFRIRRQPLEGNQDQTVPPFFDPVFKLDYASGQVLGSPAAKGLSFEIRSPEALSGCDQIPTVDTETGLNFKP